MLFHSFQFWCDIVWDVDVTSDSPHSMNARSEINLDCRMANQELRHCFGEKKSQQALAMCIVEISCRNEMICAWIKGRKNARPKNLIQLSDRCKIAPNNHERNSAPKPSQTLPQIRYFLLTLMSIDTMSNIWPVKIEPRLISHSTHLSEPSETNLAVIHSNCNQH